MQGADVSEETEPLLAHTVDAKATPDAKEKPGYSVLFLAMSSFMLILFMISIVWWTKRHFIGSHTGAPKAVLLEELPNLLVRRLHEKPHGDPRHYQHTLLENGLQVLNVQDERASSVAMAMAVKSGSFNDPDALPGLAHFCEHMLFLGTEKYPDPSGFDQFVSANGGFSNAFTAEEATVYFTEFFQASAEEGFDRFADFFRAPLFNRSLVEREVHAIDSEHAKNVQDPVWRTLQVMKSLADPDSKVDNFHTGNLKTLRASTKSKSESLVDKLKVYFDNHYCPQHMRLVTFGPMPLKKQLSMVQRQFDKITPGSKNCEQPPNTFEEPRAFPRSRMAKWVDIEGTLPTGQLWIHFPLPDVSKHFKSQPLDYMAYIIGYGGVNSFKQVLTDTSGLASGMKPMFDLNTAGSNIYLVVDLTPKGTQNIDVVFDLLFTYFATVRKNGVDPDLYQSIADIEKLKWDWPEMPTASSAAKDLAERMTRLPADDILSGDSLIKQFNATLVESLLADLRPENMNVGYNHPKPSGEDAGGFALARDAAEVQTLPHYGVKYAVMDIKDRFPGHIEKWNKWLEGRGAESEARLTQAQLNISPVPPKSFDHVPKDINLDHMRAAAVESTIDNADIKQYGARPTRQSGEDALFSKAGAANPEVWYREGWVTTSPKVSLQIIMRLLKDDSEPEVSAQRVAELDLYGRLLNDELAPHLADLTETGVSYDIKADSDSLTFKFGGFPPSLDKLIDSTLERFNAFNRNVSSTPAARFSRQAQSFRDGLVTFSKMPTVYAIADRNLLLTKGSVSRGEELQAMEKLSLKSVVESVGRTLLARPLQVTALVMGNLPAEDATHAVRRVAAGVEAPDWIVKRSEEGGSVQYMHPIVKITQPVELRTLNPRQGDSNDVAIVSLLHGVVTVSSRIMLYLLGDILQPLAYDELRTTRQLGYVVSAGAGILSNVMFITCVVQGNKLKADDAEAAIESVFSDHMPRRLRELTDSEFEQFRGSLMQKLLQPPAKAGDEVEHFWTPVYRGGQCFDLRNEMLRFLNSSLVSKAALSETWAKLATPDSGVRSKIAVKYFAHKVPERRPPEEARAAWVKQSVAASHEPLLLREHEKTLVLNKADSKARERLAENAGYHAQDLNCAIPARVNALLDKRASGIRLQV